MKKTIELKILGELCSKSNSRRIVTRGKYPRIIKSQKALDYEKSALIQIASQLKNHKPFTNYVGIEAHIWYGSRRPDLDVSLLQDILEKAGIYKNDRQVIEIKALKYLNKKEPKVIVKIYEVSEENIVASGL